MDTLSSQSASSKYRWYVLIIAALTFTFSFATQQIAMSVLFDEILNDLGLTVVQVGIVWGIIALAGLFVVFLGGMMADRYGARRMLIIACIAVGLTGAMRGLATDFITLALTTFLFGLAMWLLPGSVFKTTATWFAGKQLVIANGVVSTGMGVGFTLSSMFSATLLSPMLGGWRHVFFLYGALSIVIGIVWLFAVRGDKHPRSPVPVSTVPIGKAVKRVFRNRAVWLIGLMIAGYVACTQGLVGYLPLYLRGVGWTVATADGTLAAFTGFSMLGAIPLVLLSDRLGVRKGILMPIFIITFVGVALLPLVSSALVWVVVIVVGFCRDGFMAISLTMNMEAKGIGAAYAGTATGLAHSLLNAGAFISPPLGNSLANFNAGFPFFVWAAFAFFGLAICCFVRAKESRHSVGEMLGP